MWRDIWGDLSVRNRTAIAMALLAAGASIMSASSASAAGCNGVVNPVVWGCAPWDNNNGPGFPNYKAPAARSNNSGYQGNTNAATINGVRNGASGGRLLGNDAGSLIGQDGNSMRRGN